MDNQDNKTLHENLLFDLVSRGHIPIIQSMLKENKSWEEIGKEIGCDSVTAERHYRWYLESEIKRLKEGRFTEEEFQNLCHVFSEDDRERFCNGCDEYQRKLFGICRSDILKNTND